MIRACKQAHQKQPDYQPEAWGLVTSSARSRPPCPPSGVRCAARMEGAHILPSVAPQLLTTFARAGLFILGSVLIAASWKQALQILALYFASEWLATLIQGQLLPLGPSFADGGETLRVPHRTQPTRPEVMHPFTLEFHDREAEREFSLSTFTSTRMLVIRGSLILAFAVMYISWVVVGSRPPTGLLCSGGLIFTAGWRYYMHLAADQHRAMIVFAWGCSATAAITLLCYSAVQYSTRMFSGISATQHALFCITWFVFVCYARQLLVVFWPRTLITLASAIVWSVLPFFSPISCLPQHVESACALGAVVGG
jgi:hypothetical protein